MTSLTDALREELAELKAEIRDDLTHADPQELERRYGSWGRLLGEPITGLERDANILMRDMLTVLKDNKESAIGLGKIIAMQNEENARLRSELKQAHAEIVRLGEKRKGWVKV